MKLGELLSDGLVICGFSAADKEEAIRKLLDAIVSAGKFPPALRETALKAILDRERSLSTGMEHGIAIPHGSIDEIDEMACALGISPAGVAFASLDGLPAHLIILIVIPRRRFSRHVQTLAGIARLLNHAPMRERLRRADSPAEVMRIIHEEERESP